MQCNILYWYCNTLPILDLLHSSATFLTMGAAESKEDKEERERDEAVYDPRYISWDEHGNLRYGIKLFVFLLFFI